jgi:hypothetical protein
MFDQSSFLVNKSGSKQGSFHYLKVGYGVGRVNPSSYSLLNTHRYVAQFGAEISVSANYHLTRRTSRPIVLIQQIG